MQALQVRSILSPVRNAILVLMLTLTLPAAITQAQSVIYVDINNGDDDPPNFGRNGWGEDAFRFLQDALAAADIVLGFPDIEEVDIWVAAGVYKPDHDKNSPDGTCDEIDEGWFNCTTTLSFTIPNNVRIFGGFVGGPSGETSLEDRNGGVHDPTLTILTGDLADGNAETNLNQAHSANVVTFANTDSTARLDTVTIKRGWSETVTFDTSSAILSNSIITESAATAVNVKGAGVPRIINCRFIDNKSDGTASSLRINAADAGREPGPEAAKADRPSDVE